MSHDNRSNGGRNNESRMDLLKPDMQPQRMLQSEQDIWDLVKIRSNFSFRSHLGFAFNATIRPTHVSFMVLFSYEKFPLLIFN